jgi:hypothetical protein
MSYNFHLEDEDIPFPTSSQILAKYSEDEVTVAELVYYSDANGGTYGGKYRVSKQIGKAG